ncbi:hypothetical protein E8E14_014231 [Neopestalotiopsis sp. 37M]|nr:hypothetical protein E8E14_014231 [Neopestalotiopsis sp. 37M]
MKISCHLLIEHSVTQGTATAMDLNKEDHEDTARDTIKSTTDTQNAPECNFQSIKYKVEYLHPVTNEIISSQTTTRPGEENDDLESHLDPVFEIVTTYQVRITDGSERNDAVPPRKSFKAPTKRLDIYSSALRNALRSVVKYYPSQDLSGDVIAVEWPYCVLVHHYDELNGFREICAAKNEEELCERERDAKDHITLLLNFLDENIMKEVRVEQQRNQRGFFTWEYYWVPIKPGRIWVTREVVSKEHKGRVIKSVSDGAFNNPRTAWEVIFWQLEFDGERTVRVERANTFSSFDGETEMGELLEEDHITEDSIESLSQNVRDQYENGKRYWNLISKNCQFYKGKTEDFPFNEVQGLVMTDLKAFYAQFPSELLHVKNFEEPNFQEKMIEGLVMSQQRKNTLIALASSFARRSRDGEKLTDEMWSADFVKGKGNGLIFLLHGQPGVGKTYTAECIAAYAKRPLMTLTASDIGTIPTYIETNLTHHFRRAKSWGAVLLIDEADVFMERRTSSDLERNSLVAGFLRALEYYDGMLFLTTNRVGAFDDAFISRIHIQMYYGPFDNDEKRKVWKTFVDKLSDERGDYIRLNAAAKEYISSKEVCSINWNGREIKNAFQTAVALAEYGSKKDAEGTILVTDDHFRSVMELSHDFKNYLHELHRRDEAKRAEIHVERLDSYKKN